MEARSAAARGSRVARLAWWTAGLAFLAFLVYLMATASGGPIDPTDTSERLSSGQAVFNSAIIVFREGLEAVLIFAAVTASFLGDDRRRRRPVVLGAAVAFAATVAVWFGARLILDEFAYLGPRLEAITGLIAIVVLLVVLNWFFHKMYWTGWIARHHRRRRQLLASSGAGVVVGLVALGFTSVFREGFEVVLFLQSLQLKAGDRVVLEGVALGLAGTAVVGIVTFALHHRLPYRRMLVLTGVLIGVVLVVMIGGTARTFQDLGWLPTTPIGFSVPGWVTAWFEIVPTVETLAIQLAAALFVVGSYYAAQYWRVRRPARRGEPVAHRAEVAPQHGG